MPEYKLDFPVNVGSAAPVRGLADAVRQVADNAKLSEGNLRLFNEYIAGATQRTGNLGAAIRELATKKNTFQDLAKEVQSFVKEQEKAQNVAQKMGRIMEQAYGEGAKRVRDAQNETQKLGRMMESAYADNAKRAEAASARIIAAKKKELAEAEAVAKQQTNLTKSLLLATGGSSAVPGGYMGANLLGQAGGAGALIGAAAITAIAAAAAAATKEMISLANETGEYAREQQNISARTGLTLRETQEFSQIAQVAGVNVGSLTTSMRALSKGLSENSEDGKQAKQALKELGLDSSVAFEPTGRAISDIFTKLGQLQDGFEKDRLAIALFGRGGLELLPLVNQFKELEARVKSAGNVMDEAGIQKAAEYQKQVTLLGQAWDQLKRKMGEDAIGVIRLFLGGKDISLGNIADQLLTGGAVGAYHDFIASPTGPKASSLLPGAPDPYAVMKEQRSSLVDSLAFHTGTPRQQLESQLKKTESDRQSASNRYIEGGKPEDLQKVKDLDKSLASLQARLDALKKTAMSFSEELARYANKGEPNEFARRIAENREQATALERQFPGKRGAIEATEYSNLAKINNDAKAEIAKFQAHLQSEGEREAERFYTEQIKALTGTEGEQRQQNRIFRTGTGRTIGDYAELYKTGKLSFAEDIRGVSNSAKDQTQSLQLGQAFSSGALRRAGTSGQLSAGQLSSMELQQQLSYILRQSSIQSGEFSTQAQMYRERAGNSYGTDKQELLDKATEAEAKAKENEAQATIQAVDAVNKFRDAAAEASAHIREQFSSFASGLVGAARSGNAGEFSKNFMLGQFDKMVGNAASGMYKPGMLQFPGLSGNPAMEKLFQGTMFGKDPLSGKQEPVIKSTDDNTKATQDNTTILAAVYQALGGDPTSLGLSAGVPLPSGLSLPGGLSIPGLTDSGGAFESGSSGGGIGSLMKLLGIGGAAAAGGVALSTGAGIFGPTDANGLPVIPGVTAPASSSSAAAPGSSNPFAGTVEAPLFSSDASASTKFSAGIGTAAALYGAFTGVQDITKGGAQNITAGIGKFAGSAAALDPEPISKGILAGVSLVSGIVSSLMGDPKANREAHISHALFNNQYVAPQALNRSMNISGNYSDIDFRGNVRGSDLSSIPIARQASEDPRHGVVAPGSIISPFGGGSQPNITVNNNVSAIDQDSVAKFFQSNPQALGDGVVHALNTGGTDLANRLRTF